MKSVVLVAPNDQAGTDIASVDADAYSANGVRRPGISISAARRTSRPSSRACWPANPDAVDTASSPPGDAGVIVKQLRLAGFTGPIGRVGGPGTAEILRVCGGMDVLKDFYWFETVPTDDPNVRAIDDEYRKLLGNDPVGGTTFWSYLPARTHDHEGDLERRAPPMRQKVAAVLRTMPVEDPNIGKGYWTGKK